MKLASEQPGEQSTVSVRLPSRRNASFNYFFSIAWRRERGPLEQWPWKAFAYQSNCSWETTQLYQLQEIAPTTTRKYTGLLSVISFYFLCSGLHFWYDNKGNPQSTLRTNQNVYLWTNKWAPCVVGTSLPDTDTGRSVLLGQGGTFHSSLFYTNITFNNI